MAEADITIYLAAPRGFCAGVDRAIKIVAMALEKWGPPVYVRHDIVHNRYVVDDLRSKGAVFVEELDECPDDRPVIFSAHGVPKSVPAEADRRNMIYVDATCPLVSKVHIEAARHHGNGLQMIMVGHAGHPRRSAPWDSFPRERSFWSRPSRMSRMSEPRDPGKLAYITQTTLSVDDTAEIVAALKARFPSIAGPHKEDICYAATNRQAAVKAIAPRIDALLAWAHRIHQIQAVWSRWAGRLAASTPSSCSVPRTSTGARSKARAASGSRPAPPHPKSWSTRCSTPFGKVQRDVEREAVETATENVEFKVPRILRDAA